jgi:hypothetical protein
MTANTATARYEWHPAANLFPLLSGEEFDALVTDIRAEGLHNPIVLHEGLVLDGRNRLLACEKAGVEPRFEQWSGKGSPTAWVLSLNLQRRHLTAGQRAMVAAEAKPMLAAEAKERQRAAGGDKRSQAAFVKNDKSGSEPLHARKAVARQFNVSEGSVHSAQKVKDVSPALAEQVKAGAISLPEARRQLGMKQTAKIPGADKNSDSGPLHVEKGPAESRGSAEALEAEELEIWIDDLCQACRERLFPQEAPKQDFPSDVKSAPDQTNAEVNVAREDIFPHSAPDLTYEPADDYAPAGEDEPEPVSTQKRCIEAEL